MPHLLDRMLLRIARVTLPRGEREWMSGDIEEEHAHIRQTRGAVAASRWLAAEAVRNVAHAIGLERPRLKGRFLMRNLDQDLRYALEVLESGQA